MRDDSPEKGMRLGKVREGMTGGAQWEKGSRKRNLREEKGKRGRQERLRAVPLQGTAGRNKQGRDAKDWLLHLNSWLLCLTAGRETLSGEKMQLQ